MSFSREELDHMTGQDAMTPVNFGGVSPTCPGCGYNLTGAVSARCPECGREIQRKLIRQEAVELRVKIESLKGIQDWVEVGVKLAAFGVFLSLSAWALRKLVGDPFLPGIVRGAAVLCALVAPFLVLGVIRVYRVPACVREEYSLNPKWLLVFLTLALSGATMVLSWI